MPSVPIQAVGYPFVLNIRIVGLVSPTTGRDGWSNPNEVSVDDEVIGVGFASPSVATVAPFGKVFPMSLDWTTMIAPGSWKLGSPNWRHATSTLPFTGLTLTTGDWLTMP